RVRMCSDEILVDLHRLLRVDVHDVHEPARIVRPDRDHHEVEWPASSADVTELRVIRRIARKPCANARELERKPTPERFVPVAESASAEMAGGCGRDAEAIHVCRLPPVQLDDLAHTPW